ncbi:MAG: phosphotransferase family protein, partial [Saprospiraceae bacterium]
MTDLQPDTTKPVRPGEELNLPALNAYLRAQAPEIGELLEILQFPGGYSNLTYCLKTATKDYVLRRPPFGANIKGGHDMGREFRVLSLLQNHYHKIPKPIIFCENHDIIGAPFYIMERISGIILRTTNAPKMNLAPETLRQICAS